MQAACAAICVTLLLLTGENMPVLPPVMRSTLALRFCLPLLLAGVPAVAVHAQASGALSWERFVTPQATYDHAVLLVPISLAGVRCTAQLDTGANYPFRERYVDKDASAHRSVQLRFADLSIDVPVSATSLAKAGRGDCGNIGSIGNALLEHGSITLDLANDRFSVVQASVLAGDPGADDLTYLKPAGWEGGMLVIDYRPANGEPGAAYLDTGAALFTLALAGASAIQHLANGQLTTIAGNSAGAPVSCVLGALTAPLQIGRSTVAGGVVGSCRKALPDLGRKVDAVVGLGAFAGKRIVIDYVAQKWKVDQAPRSVP